MRPEDFHPHISEAIWTRYPEYRALSVTIAGFVLENPLPLMQPSLPVWGDAHVDSWHAAFRSFGANPKRTPPSLDGLLRRFRKEGSLPSIHPVVDLYNALSLSYGAPFGGEDIACYRGSPRLIVADGTEAFSTVKDGLPAVENPEPGEIVWRDEEGVTCRRWNWRQCKRTAITAASQDLWFVIDRLPPMSIDDLQRAGEALAAGLISASPGSSATVKLLAPAT